MAGIVVPPGAIQVGMLGPEFLRVGAMFPFMELVVVAHIAVGIGDRDVTRFESACACQVPPATGRQRVTAMIAILVFIRVLP